MRLNQKKFKILYKAVIASQNKNTDIRLWCVRPTNTEYQQISNFSLSHKPQKEYKDQHSNIILYFNFTNLKKLDFTMEFNTLFWQRTANLSQEKSLTASVSRNTYRQYTSSEKFLEQTPAVKNLVLQITKNKTSALDKIFAVSNFLRSNFKYKYPVKNRGVKNLNLENLRGDCGEVGALFVTMCRILKIPALNQTGYVIYHDELDNIYEHGWTSIYLKNRGWLEIDPLASNIIKEKGNYRYKQNNYFLTLTKGFNIELCPSIPKNYKTSYWKKIGLPLTKNSVQILQPLVFASNGKVSFKDKITLLK